MSKRGALKHLHSKYAASVRRCSKLLGLANSTLHYKAKAPRADESLIREWMIAFTSRKTRHGRNRVVWYLRQVEGFKDNHKRISRVYRELNLQIGKRIKGRRLRAGLRLVLEKPTQPRELWAMDFVSDSFSTGRKFRSLTITDLFTHESPRIEVDVSLTGERVAQVTTELKQSIGLPRAIICDNGPELFQMRLIVGAMKTKLS